MHVGFSNRNLYILLCYEASSTHLEDYVISTILGMVGGSSKPSEANNFTSMNFFKCSSFIFFFAFANYYFLFHR